MDQSERTEIPDLSDQDEGVFSTYEEQEARAGKREAELQMSHAELAEWGRAANYRARQLAQENEQLRALLGVEPGVVSDLVELADSGHESEIAAPQPQNEAVDDRGPNVGGVSSLDNDLVRVAVREAVIQLLPELLKDALPRQRGIEVHIPGEGRARIDALEVVARTYSALVDTVAQLAARSSKVATEDGYWSLGVEDETASLLAQVALASPRRPKAVNHSRSVLWL